MPPKPRYKKNQLRLTNTLIIIFIRVNNKRANLYIIKNRANSAVNHIRKG